MAALIATPNGALHPARATDETNNTVQDANGVNALILPPNFIDEPIITNLAPPRAFVFAPDGRIFVTEAGDTYNNTDINTASIRIYKNGALLPDRAVALSVCGDGERGLLGMALDPDFETNGYLYVYYTRQSGTSPSCGYDTWKNGVAGPRNRVSRLTMVGDHISTASEVVLIDNIIQDPGIHNAGDLHFGHDGYLYVSVGESGYGDLLAPTKNSLNGKILRIKPSTSAGGGYSTSGNPFDAEAGSLKCGTLTPTYHSNGDPPFDGACKEVYAYGFRNPFRFAVQADGNKIFVNDVGGGSWEEVSELAAGGNFGWPRREGPCNAGNQCTYPPQTPSGYVDPVYAYSHYVNGSGVDTAVTGGAFIPTATGYPAGYAGSYVVADGYQGFMRRLTYNQQTGLWTPVSPDFATNADYVITLQSGPDGNLYYLTFDGSPGRVHQLRRIRYALAENIAPTAKAGVTPSSSGQLNTLYTFSAAGSNDPDGNTPLSYAWNFGDGATVVTSAVTVTHQYALPGIKNVSLVVTDKGSPAKSSAPATLQVFPGNAAPTATIVVTNTTALSRTQYYAGDSWTFGATNLSDDQALPPNALQWSVIFHHDTHTHPFLSGVSGITGTFQIPTIGEIDPDVWYRVTLDVTDAQGQMATFTKDVFPVTTTVAINSSPPGALMQIDADVHTAPFTVTRVVGIFVAVDVISTTQTLNGEPHQFIAWSDGFGAQHNFNVAPNTVLTATYVASDTLTNRYWLPFASRE